MEQQKELTLLMYESNSVFGRWTACLVESIEMDDEAFALEALAGHGDTALEAAANLLAMAVRECKRR